jgi:hypothetical protein
MAASPDLAGVVQQSLPDVLPDGLWSGQPDSIGLLDLDGPAAAPAGDPQQVSLDVAKPLRPARGTGRASVGASVP